MSLSLFSLLISIMLNRALYVAADLNIADHLAVQPMTVEQLADKTHTNSAALQRMLYFLELHDVFHKKEDLHYHLTDFSQSMRADAPNSIKPFLLHDDPTRWNSFGHLGYSIATNNASFDMLYNVSYFDFLQQNPQLNTQFNQAMTMISAEEDSMIATKLTFEHTVADIGGGTGQLLKNIASNNTITQGILFDLPQVVEQAKDMSFNCLKIGGSFFDPLPFTADTFVLKRILHDWDNEKALSILKNISNAMNSNAKLYIIEGILDYSKDRKLLAAIDLGLLTIFKGAERSKSTFDTLIQDAGLEITAIQQLTDLVCAIECRKKA